MSLYIVIAVLFFLMLGLGTSLHLRDFLDLLHRPQSLILGIFGQVILLPFVAFAICSFFSLDGYAAVGMMLVASCSGGASSNILTMLIRGNVALSSLLTVTSSLLSIVSLPLLLSLVMHYFLREEMVMAIPVDKTMAQLIFTMAFPLVLVMYIRRWPRLSGILQWSVKKSSLLLLIGMISLFIFENHLLLLGNAAYLLFPLFLLIIFAGGGISLLGSLFKIPASDNRTLVVEVGIQNAAQAMTISLSPFLLNDPRFAVPAIVYALVMNLVFIGFTLIYRFKFLGK